MWLLPPYPYPLAFHELLQDPSASHSRDLAQATTARAKLRSTVKRARKAPDQGDWVAANRAALDYLPYLYAILSCVESDDLLLPNEPVFVWKSTLSTTALLKRSRPKITLPSLHFELLAVLLTQALCLANSATSLVASLGSYELSRSVSTAAIAVHDETINSAAEMLCRAAGVMLHCEEVVIPRWEAAVGTEILSLGRPIEMTREGCRALGKVFLADANLLAIRRLLSRSKSTSYSTITPGPPLSTSHPSPSLLAKLNINVYTLYDESHSLLRRSPSSPLKSSSTAPFIPEIIKYISMGRTISLALSYKWLGIDKGENGGREGCGEAICWLGMSESELKEVEGGGKGVMGIGKAKGKGGKVNEELESVRAFISGYKKVNDTVHFQTIPLPSTLMSQIPTGRAALPLKSFLPPPPAFTGKTSAAATRYSPTDNFDALDLGDSSDEEVVASKVDGETTAYFGAGSYW